MFSTSPNIFLLLAAAFLFFLLSYFMAAKNKMFGMKRKQRSNLADALLMEEENINKLQTSQKRTKAKHQSTISGIAEKDPKKIAAVMSQTWLEISSDKTE